MMASTIVPRCSKQLVPRASLGSVRRLSSLVSPHAWKHVASRTSFPCQHAQRPEIIAFSFARSFSSGGTPPLVIQMPSLSPTMTQGNLSSWQVKVGDRVKPGTVLAIIETDKASMEFEAQEEGYVAKLLVESGTEPVQVGQPILVLVEEVDQIKNVDAVPKPATAAASKPVPATPKAAPAASPKAPATPARKFPPHLVLQMPSLSPTMTTGNIVAWRVKLGDRVKPGSILAEIETDKATMDFECQEEGYVVKLLVSDGSKGVRVGMPILVIADDKDSISDFSGFTVGDEPATPAPSPPQPPSPSASTQSQQSQQKQQQPTASKPTAQNQRVIASPLAKQTAKERGLDLSQIAGSGPDGRIIQQDVLTAKTARAATAPVSAASATSAPSQTTAAPAVQRFPTIQAAAGTFTEIPHSNIRRIIAQKLTEAKQSIPHFYLSIDCTMDNLVQLRSRINAAFGETTKVSVNDLVLKACACALREVPGANASFHQDSVRIYDYVDISVAMQTDAGLLVPVVRGVHAKGLHEIARATRTLGEKGKAGKLAPQEMEGGTFTVSNLGMFGVKQFSAIINPPQACILAVGATDDRAVVVNGKVEVHKVMSVTLSCDHRVVDGVLGAKWLQAFKKFIEDPTLMLL
eukprot:c5787_g1_i1.p1 GENE.c5787_g1_i1~~c5787_g1_i1.p1  ORF type:complete len:645 (-),score=176.24 c5787_g1_i1:232-2133(-)